MLGLPLCAHCLARSVKRRGRKYCSTACRDRAATKPRSLCAHCKRNRVQRAHRYCSLACGHAPLKVQRRWCAAKCGARVKANKSRFCSRSCAWLARGGRAAAAKGRQKALEVLRQQYVARLRERLKSMTSIGQVWQLAYRRGYTACWQTWKRKIERGEVIMVKERTRLTKADAA